MSTHLSSTMRRHQLVAGSWTVASTLLLLLIWRAFPYHLDLTSEKLHCITKLLVRLHSEFSSSGFQYLLPHFVFKCQQFMLCGWSYLKNPIAYCGVFVLVALAVPHTVHRWGVDQQQATRWGRLTQWPQVRCQRMWHWTQCHRTHVAVAHRTPLAVLFAAASPPLTPALCSTLKVRETRTSVESVFN